MSERKVEKQIAIDATPEEVWRAVSEGDGLKQWFPLDARVTPGEGGKVWLSWGEGAEWESPIEIWKPGRQMRTVDEMPGKEGAPPTRIAVDYIIESAGGQTVLRLVHSGFGEDTWQDELDALDSGWAAFLENLKLYLERHRGESRSLVHFRHAPIRVRKDDAYVRALRALGIDSVDALQAGSRFDTTSRQGDHFRGEVRIAVRPRVFAAIAENWGDGFLMVEIEGGRERCRPAIWLSLYGSAAKRAGSVEDNLRKLLVDEFRDDAERDRQTPT